MTKDCLADVLYRAYCRTYLEYKRNAMKNDSYCKVCLIDHDEEIHEATLNVREWHRWEVVKGFAELELDEADLEELEAAVA